MAAAVDRLLESDEVALCGPVLTEIGRGLRSAAERRRILPLLGGCHLLEQPAALWREAGDLGYLLGRKGAAVKSLDLLIAVYALSHAIAVLTSDTDFDLMRKAGIGLLLVDTR